MKINKIIFCLSSFQIFKKTYLQIFKNLGQFFLHTLCKYLERYTYKSPNNWPHFLLIPLFKYFKKYTYKSENT